MKVVSTILILILCQYVFAQQAPQREPLTDPDKYARHIQQQTTSLQQNIDKQTSRYLKKMQKHEQKLAKHLRKIDSVAATDLLKSGEQTINQIQSKLTNVIPGNSKAGYNALLDTLQTSLRFFDKAGKLTNTSALSSIKGLEQSFSGAGAMQNALEQRQQYLQNIISNYSSLPKGLSKSLGKYQQEVYYYTKHVQELKATLKDSDKLVRKTLSIVRQQPVFKEFMQKNSVLASLFPEPAGYGTAAALTGLQNRNSVQQMIQQQLPQLGSGGVNNTGGNPTQYFQQQMQAAQSELDAVKEKLNKLGNGSSGNTSMVIPDFTPNQQKTKSFLQRLELGSNLQTQRSNYYFQITTDVAFTAGYRLNDKAVIGLGLSGRMGWGESWKRIRITGQGIGLRSYADIKAPDLFKTKSKFMGSLWLTAGAELNYNKPVAAFSDLKDHSNWYPSGLAGLTKKFAMRSPLKKGKQSTGNIQILYDFLHKTHIPHTPAFVWRVGYGL